MNRAAARRALVLGALAAAGPAAAETVAVARDPGGAALSAACPEAPFRAVLSGHPVPLPAVPRARLFRYRIDGGPPAVGVAAPHPDGVALRFPNDSWLGADLVALLLPGAWQRLDFAPAPEAARRCGAAPKTAGKRALVAAIQSALAARGLDPGRADGVFDAATGAAIEAYQRYFGPRADGVPSPALRDRMARDGARGQDLAALAAMAARVESAWRPPAWARGAWSAAVALRIRLDAGGRAAAAEPAGAAEGTLGRLARSAAEAALAAGPLAAAGAPREVVLRVALPVSETSKRYARAVTRRLAARGRFGRLPPGAPGGRAAELRLHIDGAARTVRAEMLDTGALAPAQVARVRAAVGELPRLPPPPDEGANVFVMDVTLFARPPHVVAGRTAFSDWPGGR